jgi:hypothetical protein
MKEYERDEIYAGEVLNKGEEYISFTTSSFLKKSEPILAGVWNILLGAQHCWISSYKHQPP